MNTIYDGTTPKFALAFREDPYFNDAQSIVVTISTDYSQKLLELTGDDLVIDQNTNTVSFSLSQNQTFMLSKHGSCFQIQVNILYKNGTRCCSAISKVMIEKNLKREVMS